MMYTCGRYFLRGKALRERVQKEEQETIKKKKIASIDNILKHT